MSSVFWFLGLGEDLMRKVFKMISKRKEKKIPHEIVFSFMVYKWGKILSKEKEVLRSEPGSPQLVSEHRFDHHKY